MKKIKLGFIGCGRISNSHFDVLKKLHDKIDVIAICDPSEEKALSASSLFGSKHYIDIEKMLSENRLDLVTVATPNAMHPKHSILCANYGADILCEKPIAVHQHDAIELKNTFKKLNRNFFAIYQNRYNDTVAYVANAIKNNRFGKIYSITSNVFWHRSQEYYDKRPWHGTKDLDGGAFMTQASHYVDLINWFADSPVDYVYASLDTLARKIETEDTGSAIIKWKNGIIGNINLSILTYPDNFEGSITIIGETGTVKLGGVALNKIEHSDFKDRLPIDDEIKKLSYDTESVYGFGHAAIYEKVIEFYNSLDSSNNSTSKSGLVGIEEAYDSFCILEAIVRSSKQNQPVQPMIF